MEHSDEPFPQSQRYHLQALVAAGRDAIEAEISPRPAQTIRRRRRVMRSLGAVALGIFAAGIAVFLTAVILNLLFHFSPS